MRVFIVVSFTPEGSRTAVKLSVSESGPSTRAEPVYELSYSSRPPLDLAAKDVPYWVYLLMRQLAARINEDIEGPSPRWDAWYEAEAPREDPSIARDR